MGTTLSCPLLPHGIHIGDYPPHEEFPQPAARPVPRPRSTQPHRQGYTNPHVPRARPQAAQSPSQQQHHHHRHHSLRLEDEEEDDVDESGRDERDRREGEIFRPRVRGRGLGVEIGVGVGSESDSEYEHEHEREDEAEGRREGLRRRARPLGSRSERVSLDDSYEEGNEAEDEGDGQGCQITRPRPRGQLPGRVGEGEGEGPPSYEESVFDRLVVG